MSEQIRLCDCCGALMVIKDTNVQICECGTEYWIIEEFMKNNTDKKLVLKNDSR